MLSVALLITYWGSIVIVWKNKRKILEGIWNSLFPNAFVERVAAERDKLCQACPLYDATGKAENCFVKGSACCSFCGCKLSFKQRALSVGCDKGVWGPVMSQEEEDAFREKHKIVNQ